MIQHLKHTEINKEKWDCCIRQSPNGSIFAYSWYLDVVSPGWEALVECDYENIFPLTGKKKYGIQYLFQPFFTHYWDVYAMGKTSNDQKSKFIAAIPQSFRYIDYAIAGQKELEIKNVTIAPRVAQFMDLNKEYTSLRKLYSENLIRNLKKAEKARLEISENVSPASLVALFRKENQKKVKEFKKREYRIMEDALLACIKKNRCIMMGVRGGTNEYCTIAAFLLEKNRIIYFKGATDEEGKKKGAMHFLMDTIIRRFSGENFIYDFGGSNVPGVARFNHHFGAEDYAYYSMKKNMLPGIVKWIKK